MTDMLSDLVRLRQCNKTFSLFPLLLTLIIHFPSHDKLILNACFLTRVISWNTKYQYMVGNINRDIVGHIGSKFDACTGKIQST